jgi:ribosomal protein S14
MECQICHRSMMPYYMRRFGMCQDCFNTLRKKIDGEEE